MSAHYICTTCGFEVVGHTYDDIADEAQEHEEWHVAHDVETATPLAHDDVRAIVREEIERLVVRVLRLREDLSDRFLERVLKAANDLNQTQEGDPVDVGDTHARVGGLDEGPLQALREAGLLEDPEVAVSKLLGRHNASPSVDGCGDLTVGDGPDSGAELNAPESDDTFARLATVVAQAKEDLDAARAAKAAAKIRLGIAEETLARATGDLRQARCTANAKRGI